MNVQQQETARRCQERAEGDRITFPEIVEALTGAGFEGYMVDFRRGAATYYLSDGGSTELPIHQSDVPIAATFDADEIRAGIRQAQSLAPGYTYLGFCDRARRAGCAGYIVSFPGRRVLYFGRTADFHVEQMPAE